MIVRVVGKPSAMLLLTVAALLSTAAVAQKSNGNPAAKTGNDATAPKYVKFEVASITPVKPGMQTEMAQTFVPTPDGYRSSLTVGQMIMLAYGPSDPQLWHGIPLVNW